VCVWKSLSVEDCLSLALQAFTGQRKTNVPPRWPVMSSLAVPLSVCFIVWVRSARVYGSGVVETREVATKGSTAGSNAGGLVEKFLQECRA
jgi:hypothetical protein